MCSTCGRSPQLGDKEKVTDSQALLADDRGSVTTGVTTSLVPEAIPTLQDGLANQSVSPPPNILSQ